MIVALSVAVLLAAGSGIGWFAHRAYLRIEAWGRTMNKQDAIFRDTSEEEIDGALRRVRVIDFSEAPETTGVHVTAAK